MTDAKDIANRIDRYFGLSAAGPLPGEGGKKRAKSGEPDAAEKYPPTMAGLAVALGMTREELLAAKPDGEAGRLIAHARARVEAFAEEKLFDKNAASGAKFALARNCPSWDGNREDTPPEPALLTDEELEDRIRQLGGE